LPEPESKKVKTESVEAESSAASLAKKHMAAASRRALWMRYLRSREPAGGKRASRIARPPPDVLEAMAKNPLQKNRYFDLWVGHDQDWGKVMLWERTFTSTSTKQGLTERWLTYAQVVEAYRSEVVAKAICGAKVLGESKRRHPEAPDVDEAVQYLCAVAADKVQERTNVHEQGASFQGELQGPGANRALQETLAACSRPLAQEQQRQPQQQQQQLHQQTASARGQDAEDEQKAEQKRKAEEQRKATAEQRRREAAERKKNDPDQKRKQWIQGLAKDARKCRDLVRELGTSQLDELLKAEYKKRFGDFELRIEAMINAMENTAAPLDPATFTEAEDTVKKLRVDTKAYCRLKDVYAVAPATAKKDKKGKKDKQDDKDKQEAEDKQASDHADDS
jgi:hypothetical protein